MKDNQMYVVAVAFVAAVALFSMSDFSLGSPVVMDESGDIVAEGAEAANLVGDARKMRTSSFYVVSDNQKHELSRTDAIKALKAGVYVEMSGISDRSAQRIYKRYGFNVAEDGVYKGSVAVVVDGVYTQEAQAMVNAYAVKVNLQAANGKAIAAEGKTAYAAPADTKLAAVQNSDYDASVQSNNGTSNATMVAQGWTQTAATGTTATAAEATTKTAAVGPSAYDASGSPVVCMSVDGSAGVLVNQAKVAELVAAQEATLQVADTQQAQIKAQEATSWDCSSPRTAHGQRACVYGRHAYGYGTGYWTATCMKGQWTINGGKCKEVVTEKTTHQVTYDCKSPEGMNGDYTCIRDRRFVCKGTSWVEAGGSCAQ